MAGGFVRALACRSQLPTAGCDGWPNSKIQSTARFAEGPGIHTSTVAGCFSTFAAASSCPKRHGSKTEKNTAPFLASNLVALVNRSGRQQAKVHNAKRIKKGPGGCSFAL